MNATQLLNAYRECAAADAKHAQSFDLLTVLDAPAAPTFTPAARAGKMIAEHGLPKALGMAVFALLDDSVPASTAAVYRELAWAAIEA